MCLGLVGEDKAGFAVLPTEEQSTTYGVLEIEQLVLYSSCHKFYRLSVSTEDCLQSWQTLCPSWKRIWPVSSVVISSPIRSLWNVATVCVRNVSSVSGGLRTSRSVRSVARNAHTTSPPRAWRSERSVSPSRRENPLLFQEMFVQNIKRRSNSSASRTSSPSVSSVTHQRSMKITSVLLSRRLLRI